MISNSSVAQIKAAKIGYIIISILFSAIGIFMIIHPFASVLVLCYLIGTLLIAFGMIKMIGYSSKDLYRLAFQYDLAFGILDITLGLIICFFPLDALSLLYITIGILILADGLFRIQLAIDAKSFGIRSWWLILSIAIITSVFGSLLIIRPTRSASILMVVFGITLLSEGILNLCVSISAIKISKVLNEDYPHHNISSHRMKY